MTWRKTRYGWRDLPVLLRSRAAARQRKHRRIVADRTLDSFLAAPVVNYGARKETRGGITRWHRRGSNTKFRSQRLWDAMDVVPFTYPRLPIVSLGRTVGYKFIRDFNQYRAAHRAAVDAYGTGVRRRNRHFYEF